MSTNSLYFGDFKDKTEVLQKLSKTRVISGFFLPGLISLPVSSSGRRDYCPAPPPPLQSLPGPGSGPAGLLCPSLPPYRPRQRYPALLRLWDVGLATFINKLTVTVLNVRRQQSVN